MKTIGITGGTGLVGKHLAKLLAESGYNIIVFTRKPDKKRKYIKNTTYAKWDPKKGIIDKASLSKLYAVVHLAGEGVADKRWTEQRKLEIRDSRLVSTNFLVDQLKHHAPDCKVFISASAIGYYGADNGQEPFSEEDSPSNDFLGKTCVQWEQASEVANKFTRRVVLRFGIVLAKEGGAFKEFEKPTKFGIRPILGNGEQVLSWIHITDLVRMIRFAIERTEVVGTYNAVAPKPVDNANLMQAISNVKRGTLIPIPVPAVLIKLALGEMSTEVLKSCTVSAAKISAKGFRFEYSYIEDAVSALLKKKN